MLLAAAVLVIAAAAIGYSVGHTDGRRSAPAFVALERERDRRAESLARELLFTDYPDSREGEHLLLPDRQM